MTLLNGMIFGAGTGLVTAGLGGMAQEYSGAVTTAGVLLILVGISIMLIKSRAHMD